jgi:hypothetical protein
MFHVSKFAEYKDEEKLNENLTNSHEEVNEEYESF